MRPRLALTPKHWTVKLPTSTHKLLASRLWGIDYYCCHPPARCITVILRVRSVNIAGCFSSLKTLKNECLGVCRPELHWQKAKLTAVILKPANNLSVFSSNRPPFFPALLLASFKTHFIPLCKRCHSLPESTLQSLFVVVPSPWASCRPHTVCVWVCISTGCVWVYSNSPLSVGNGWNQKTSRAVNPSPHIS